jgi:urocanate hydratase
MAIHNVIGDSFRGASWVSIHNGGGVGWGEAINGGFGMVLDGTATCGENIVNMLHFDVHNGLARRAWARNANAVFAVQREMDVSGSFRITLPNAVNDDLLETAIR